MEGLGYYVLEVNHMDVTSASVRMVSLIAMSSSHDAAISHKGEKRRNYEMAFKLEAIEYAERVSNNAAANKYKVDVKRIREWRKNKQSIVELKEKHKGQGRKKLDGGVRRAVDSDLDDIILEWIYGRRANGLRFSRKLIMGAQKANKICLKALKAGFKSLWSGMCFR